MQTANGFVFIAGGNDRQFQKLVTLLGRADLATDPRFSNNAARKANDTVLTSLLATLLVDKDGVVLADQLLEDGVPAGSVLEIPEVLNHPQVRFRDMVVEDGDYRGIGVPVKLSRTPGQPNVLPPHLGEHAHSILMEAGYGDKEIEEFFRLKVAGNTAVSEVT